MRRFRFRLERLARLADQRTDLARRELGAVAVQVHAVEARIERLHADRRAALEPDVPALLGAALAAAAEARGRATLGELARLEAERERRRAAWAERHAEAAALERLRGRRHETWRRQCVRGERDRADAFVAARTAFGGVR